jgi:hypothetical protein
MQIARPFRIRVARIHCLLLLSAGVACAPYQNVGVLSVPEGAQVFVDGEMVGVTPLRVPVSTETDHSVYVKKSGYRPQFVVLRLQTPEVPPKFVIPADVRVRLVWLGDGAGDLDPSAPGSGGHEGSDGPEGELGRELRIDVDKAPAPKR